MNSKHGQAALDFLMTYGWALLIVVLALGAIYSLGVFDLGTFVGNRATGFAQMGIVGWQLSSSGPLTIAFRNNAGTDINITRVNVTYQTQTLSSNSTVPVTSGQQSANITIGTFNNTRYGGSYAVQVSVEYVDVATAYSYIDSGNLYGRVV
ncbi:MAG: hypothetical protein NTV88_04755 [Candidatus Micrarchaeota archaeon]|nr:hypothetical protein [Candidatus Micrarchaeota archaeon]